MARISEAAAHAIQHAEMNVSTALADQTEARLPHGDAADPPPSDRDHLGRASAEEQGGRRPTLTQHERAADHRDDGDHPYLLD
jgi:hypothetical protein